MGLRGQSQLTDLHLRAVTVVLLLTVISAVLHFSSAAAAAVADLQPLIDSTSGSGRVRRDAVDKRAGRMAAWGKREPGGASELDAQGQAAAAAAELNQGAPELPDEGYVDASADRDKRPGRMTSWGKKRVDGGNGASSLDRFTPDKVTRSKWSHGTMSVWGKRSASGLDVLDDDYDMEKRGKWSVEGQPSVWGKRQADGKRGWANKNNMAVWG